MDDCRCEMMELRRLEINGHGVQFKMQCLECGRVGQPIAHAKLTEAQRMDAPPVDHSISEKYWQSRRARLIADKDGQQRQWWADYNAYLRSPEWKAKRRKVLERDNWTCQACMERPATQVHHTSYAHRFNEPLFELQAVCDECHRLITEIDRGRYETLPALQSIS